MRKLIAWNLVTLDGYFEGASPWELDWLGQVWGEELEAFSLEQGRDAAALLFGRKTYEGMAAHWSSSTGAIADFMNSVPKVVFSRTLKQVDWNNARLAGSAAEMEVTRLKREHGGNLFIFGSAELCDFLLRAGLIDELRLGMVPIILGLGSPLFKPGLPRTSLRLLEARPMRSGCIILRYQPKPEPV
jgi:dihydrofolate reductase